MTDPTPTDWRALCAELLQAIDDLPWEYDWKGNPVGPLAEIDDAPFERARAALAQPEPQGATDEELDEETATLIPWLLEEAVQAANSEAPYAAGQLTLAAQLLGERRPAIEPIPVSERLPGPDDCDESGLTCNGGGWCWWFEQSSQMWVADFYSSHYTHWLPHHALPVPQLEGQP